MIGDQDRRPSRWAGLGAVVIVLPVLFTVWWVGTAAVTIDNFWGSAVLYAYVLFGLTLVWRRLRCVWTGRFRT